MFQYVYVPEYQAVRYQEYGDVMKNQQTEETYLIIEETLEEWAAGSSVSD